MKGYLFLLVAVVFLLGLMSFASAETTVAYEDLPQAHRTLYETAMAKALAEAPRRVPAKSNLRAMTRGDFNGYTDQKSDNSLQVEYRVSDSVVKVGEKIKFYVNMNCDYPPMIYTVSGLVFDEAFNQTGSLNSSGSSTRVDDHFKALTYSYTPTTAGYVNFVFAVSDGNGNQVAVVTSTVMVCEEDDPIFQNQSVDVNADTQGNLGLMLSLDRAKVSVGMMITAQADVTTSTDPVRYRGVWTLTDEAGNILDAAETTAEVTTQGGQARLTFPYRPLQAGKLQFVINASDGEDNRIKTNTPVISVADGLYLTARLNPSSAMMAGETVTAIYEIHGHDCGQASCSVTWECCDADGNTIASTTQKVSKRSDRVTYTPWIGQMVEFQLRVSCEHFPDNYPATARIVLVGGAEDEISLNGDADGNGAVNAQDVLRIMQYESGWSVQLDAANADVNGGGAELSDAVEILRGLADGTIQ